MDLALGGMDRHGRGVHATPRQLVMLRRSGHVRDRSCAAFAWLKGLLNSSKARDQMCDVAHQNTRRSLRLMSQIEAEKYDQADARERCGSKSRVKQSRVNASI